MASNHLSKYIWLIDTIRGYKRITREEINRLWRLSPYSQGRDLPRRTFYNYRQAVENIFDINIACDPTTFEYYIEDSSELNEGSFHDWLLDSFAINNLLNDNHDISNRIVLENIPSAHHFLSIIIEAMKRNRRITITYLPFTRLHAVKNIIIEPYFVKIFRQRWYLSAYNVADKMIKIYSLDRMVSVAITDASFSMPTDVNADEFFRYSFGIISDMSEPKKIVIRVDPIQAKYLRALPLHSSQREELHDQYSLFYYNLKITYDFVQEILSHGPTMQVIAPRELQVLIVSRLKETLDLYK